MSKLSNLKASAFLAPFESTMGLHFEKLVKDVNSWLGELEGNIVSKQSGWIVGTKGRLTSKDGHTLALPLNAAWSHLVMFGMRLQAINDAGSELNSDGTVKYNMAVQSDIPACCKAWYTEYCAKHHKQLEEAKAAKLEAAKAKQEQS